MNGKRLTASEAVTWFNAACFFIGAIGFVVILSLAMKAATPTAYSGGEAEWYTTLAFFVIGTLAGGVFWLLWTMPFIIHWRYGHDPEQEAVAVGAYVATSAAVGASVAVYGKHQRDRDQEIDQRVRAALSGNTTTIPGGPR